MPSGVYKRTKTWLWSNKSKEKQSEKAKGRKHTKETKLKISKSTIGLNTWQKGKKHSIETKNKMSLSHKGENNYAWKGDKGSYESIHIWVSKWLGKPNRCEKCGISTKRMYHWASKSHLYYRKLDDWIRLCVPCHSKYDKEHHKVRKSKLKKIQNV